MSKKVQERNINLPDNRLAVLLKRYCRYSNIWPAYCLEESKKHDIETSWEWLQVFIPHSACVHCEISVTSGTSVPSLTFLSLSTHWTLDNQISPLLLGFVLPMYWPLYLIVNTVITYLLRRTKTKTRLPFNKTDYPRTKYTDVNSFFYMTFVMLHRWVCAHVERFHLLTNCVSDSSSELQCLGSFYVLRVCTIITTLTQHDKSRDE